MLLDGNARRLTLYIFELSDDLFYLLILIFEITDLPNQTNELSPIHFFLLCCYTEKYLSFFLAAKNIDSAFRACLCGAFRGSPPKLCCAQKIFYCIYFKHI